MNIPPRASRNDESITSEWVQRNRPSDPSRPLRTSENAVSEAISREDRGFYVFPFGAE